MHPPLFTPRCLLAEPRAAVTAAELSKGLLLLVTHSGDHPSLQASGAASTLSGSAALQELVDTFRIGPTVSQVILSAEVRK